MEFSDIRRYSLGDDVKKIDWKVTAKQREAYIKEFVEERELPIFLIVDVSSSNNIKKQKEITAELLATLSFTANRNNDKVGAIFFSDIIEKYIPLKKGKKHSLSILDSYLSLNPQNKKTNIGKVLNIFNKITTRRSIVFLISDFLDNNYAKTLKYTKQKHDLITIKIADRNYSRLPKGAIFELIDSETNETIVVDNLKNEIELNEENEMKKDILINTEDDYIKILMKFFKGRGKK